jgi:methylthioribose-1-phosphate isomerase
MADGIPTTVICDNMAASLMRAGRIQAVVVGADRIAANGDVANKIGTYNVAILAKEHGIPFYVAAPWSTIDLATATGEAIPIEERPAVEVTHHGGKQLTPHGVGICNPAFDVTPAKYITAIITERGVLRGPYGESLKEMELAAKTIPSSETWLYEDAEALASVKLGLKESGEGKSVYRGSFARHARK